MTTALTGGSITRRHWRVVGLFSALALLLSWPLAVRIFTHVPGVAQWAFDESTFIWNIWYFKFAVVDNLSSPLHTDLIYYPLGIDLILYTYNFYHALVAQPIYLAISLPFASNVTLLMSTILSGFGTYLLVRYLLCCHGNRSLARYQSPATDYAPIVAGLLYAFASNRAVYAALGHYDMVTTQWIPFYALTLLQSIDMARSAKQRQLSAVLAGIFFALNGLAEMITALFMAMFTVLVVLLWLSSFNTNTSQAGGIAPANRPGRMSVLTSSLLLIGVVSGLIWGPVLGPILYQFLADDFALKGWGEAIPLSTDLLGWITPTTLHPLWGSDLVAELRRVKLRALEAGVTGFRDLNTVFVGWFTLLFAIIGAVCHRTVRLWIWTSVIFGILTLGPFLQINGRYRFELDGVDTAFPLPYALLHYMPIIKANRAPNRNSVVLMLGLAVLAAFGLHWLLQRIPDNQRRRLAQLSLTVLCAVLVLFEHLTVPLPLSDARVPALYEQIAADPSPVSIMQFPLGWRNSFGTYGPERTQIQYYQTLHHKPMLGGNISRAPDIKMDYFAQLPLFQALRNVQSGEPISDELRAAARKQAGELLYLYNVGYAVFFPPIEQRPPYSDNWEETWRFAHELLPLEPDPLWADAGIEAYRVQQQPGDDQFMLDLGVPESLAYRGEGWDRAASDTPYGETASWAIGNASRLFIPLRQTSDEANYQIAMRIHPFGYPAASELQAVTPVVNGVELDTVVLPALSGWQEISVEVPAAVLVDSLNRIDLVWRWHSIPREVIPGNRQIGSTGRELPVDVDIKGFADGGFIALFDEDGNQNNGSLGRSGINVTVLHAETGAIEDMVGFDTTANEYESQNLATFVEQLPADRPVLVVSQGNAWQFLTDEAIAALQSIGTQVTKQEVGQKYLAIAGVKGASPGTAQVVIDENEAFLRISLNRDRRSLAGAVDWLRIVSH